MSDIRYRIVSNDDGDDYVIPADKESEWDAYMEAVYGGGDDDEMPDQPEWAHPVGGSPSAVTFTNPEIFGKPV